MSQQTHCSRCGLDPAEGHAFIDDRRYCHGDYPGPVSCYEEAQWEQQEYDIDLWYEWADEEDNEPQ